jgi:hypothetical protein
MIVPFIMFPIVIEKQCDNIDCQMRSLANSIYLRLAKEELVFLSSLPPAFITYYLTEKYGNTFDNNIHSTIYASTILAIQNKCKIQSHDDPPVERVIMFTSLSLLIRQLDTSMKNIVLHVNSFYRIYQLNNTRSSLKMSNCAINYKIETRIIDDLGAIAIEIIATLSKSEKRYLSEAPDVFILAWLFTTRWVFPRDDYKFVPKIVDEEFIAREMLNYLTLKYNLSLVWINEFRFMFASAYVAGELKNNDKTIDDCIHLFEVFDGLVRPKPSDRSDKKALETPDVCEANQSKRGDPHD